MRGLAILLIFIFQFSVSRADDTIVVIHQYADTLKLQDTPQTVELDADSLLLKLVAQQSRQIADSLAETDSTQMNSELADLILLAMQERLIRDSLIRDSLRIDSIRTETQQYIHDIGAQVEIQDIRVEKHIFRDDEADREDIRRAIRQQYSPWRWDARTLVQFTQNYISPNWYKGGSSNFAMLAIGKGSITYKKDKFIWENTGEWRIGATTTGKADTVHSVNITEDLFKIYSKAGYQVYSKLYTSAYLDLQTTLLPSWKTNSKQLSSTFLTPIRFNLSIGLDYKPLDWITINFSPATFKLVHATISDSTRINVTNFSIDAGKRTLSEFGSSVRVEAKYKPLREIEL